MLFVMLAGKVAAEQQQSSPATLPAARLLRSLGEASALEPGSTYQVVVHNSMSTPRASLVSILASAACLKSDIAVRDADGTLIPF